LGGLRWGVSGNDIYVQKGVSFDFRIAAVLM
jgi:hypothetical protein